MISVLASLVVSFGSWLRSRAALQLELLALRHQLQVLNRSRPHRLRLATADRWLWAWLSRKLLRRPVGCAVTFQCRIRRVLMSSRVLAVVNSALTRLGRFEDLSLSFR